MSAVNPGLTPSVVAEPIAVPPVVADGALPSDKVGRRGDGRRADGPVGQRRAVEPERAHRSSTCSCCSGRSPRSALLVSSVRPENEVKTSGWWEFFIRPKFTLDNYDAVLSSSPGSANLSHFFFNSLKITVPAVIISVGIGALAAYAFSWMKFKGRDWLFVVVVAMLVVPLQMALIPLLRLITGGAHIGSVTIFPYLHLNNTVAAVWVAHTCFGLAVLHLHPQELHLVVAEGGHRGGPRRRGRSPHGVPPAGDAAVGAGPRVARRSSSSCGSGTTC